MKKDDDEKKFEDIESDTGIFPKIWGFIRENMKFWLIPLKLIIWLIPLIIILLLMGLLIFLGGTGAAPFIYTIF